MEPGTSGSVGGRMASVSSYIRGRNDSQQCERSLDEMSLQLTRALNTDVIVLFVAASSGGPFLGEGQHYRPW
jgi:hypothetical protein